MLRNYFKIAMRNLWRSKGFSFLNIAGLSVGMASAILILLWIQNELSIDQFHPDKERIYKVWNKGSFEGKIECWETTPKILGPTLKQEFPEVEEFARTNFQCFVTSVGDKKVSSCGVFADPSFFSMFSFPMLRGNPKTALDNTSSIVLTKKMAIKMFGTADVLNQVIDIDRDHFTVSAVLEDLPPNTDFDFEFMLPWAYLKKINRDDAYWGNNSINTFIKLNAGARESAVDAKIIDVTRAHSKGTEETQIFLHPISKWHLYSKFENGKISGGMIETVRLFGIIASFILLIACINFMNLSTARSEKRAKEVGIRKVAGAHRTLLIFQFIGESILLAFFSGLLALVMVQIALPAFDLLVGKQLAIPFTNPVFWMGAVLFTLVTGAIAGSYPAFFLSSFRPVEVLKGTFRRAHAAINPRKVLVVLQFSFAIILIICTFIVVRQIRYAQDRQVGYDRGQLIFHYMTGDLNKNFAMLKNELISSGAVLQVTRTGSPMTEGWSDTWDFAWKGKSANDKTVFDVFCEDEGLAKTAGMKFVQGRDMDLTNFPSDSTAIVINESAAKHIGFKEPVGQLISLNDLHYRVIGVIKDFVLRSPFDLTRPMAILGAKGNFFNVVNMRLNPAHTTAENVSTVEKLIRKYNPDYPFENHFVDEQYARKFASARDTATLTGLFAGLTIFISCLGLFGLAAYMAESRIKEIGVRKVLGASVFSVTSLLSKDFLKLVGISIVVATPVAWYAMHSWLQNFPYRVSMEWWIFVLAGLLSLVISVLTVSFQAIKAGMSNPVNSLRSE